MKHTELSKQTQDMVYYSIFKEKKEDLESFIRKELDIWGQYENIPTYIRSIIDREFVALGKYAKRINVFEIEEKMEETHRQM